MVCKGMIWEHFEGLLLLPSQGMCCRRSRRRTKEEVTAAVTVERRRETAPNSLWSQQEGCGRSEPETDIFHVF